MSDGRTILGHQVLLRPRLYPALSSAADSGRTPFVTSQRSQLTTTLTEEGFYSHDQQIGQFASCPCGWGIDVGWLRHRATKYRLGTGRSRSRTSTGKPG